jgi:hypothetical protein
MTKKTGTRLAINYLEPFEARLAAVVVHSQVACDREVRSLLSLGYRVKGIFGVTELASGEIREVAIVPNEEVLD